MPGMQLSMGAYSRGGIGYGPGAMPMAANQPTGTTVAQQAFGIRSGYSNCGPRTAGLGSAGIGVAAALALVWLWWSLPR